MDAKRKSIIYGNCKVLSPDGNLMFKCLEKRANWYLSRNLATIISNTPLTIQLNFTPKGNGEKTEFLKEDRPNKCVVCGNKDLSCLTKHHLVPYQYRRYFPDNLKNHNSQYVVILCINCHEKYEKEFATKYKSEIQNQYDNQKTTNEAKQIKKHINALLQNKHPMPPERIENVKIALKQDLLNNGIILDDFEQSTLQYYLGIFKNPESKNIDKIIVDNQNDIVQFGNTWVKHFIESMNPQFMPNYLSDIQMVSPNSI